MSVAERKIVLASRNPDKLRELTELFAETPFTLVPASDYPGLPDVIEDGTTIEGNASRKALITAAYTGEIAVADDTSLQVTELNGFPDIFAARFSGPGATYTSNAELLLELMRDVPDGHRQARFATACVWVDPQPQKDGRPAAHTNDFPVPGPARCRWFHNPFARAIHVQDPAREWDFWNGFVDRRQRWAQYRALMETDLVSHGHDRRKLAEVAAGLFAGCPDAVVAPGTATGAPPADDAKEAAMRLPDPRIWATSGPEAGSQPPTVVTPTGLAPDAPGRAVNGPHWLEITATGRVLGRITHQRLGDGGFGYDPVFRSEGETRTLAEMPAIEKNAISHRGHALRRLLVAVRNAYGF